VARTQAVFRSRSILSVGFAVLSSFGFMGWLGLKLSPINAMLVPFLGVALGVDDVFVYMTIILEHPKYQDDPVNRMAVTMSDAGAAITVTLISNAVSFLVPSGLVRLPAVYLFTYHMAAAVILNWICMMFIVSVLLYWDIVRVQKRRSLLGFTAEGDGE
jgi:predicted RND superfamily exporter protein